MMYLFKAIVLLSPECSIDALDPSSRCVKTGLAAHRGLFAIIYQDCHGSFRAHHLGFSRKVFVYDLYETKLNASNN